MGTRELRRAAVAAARQGRASLAEAIGVLEDVASRQPDDRVLAALPTEVARVVGVLFAAETGDAMHALRSIVAAMERLSEILPRMQQHPAGVGEAIQATEIVAGTLSALHPARRELEHALAPPGESSAAVPIPLARRRGPPPESERRAWPRVDVEAEIGFHSETNFFTGFSGDLSDGGIFIATWDLLALGTALTVSFVLPGGHHVTANGHVSWVREPGTEDDAPHPGMGIEFEGLSEEDRRHIHRFLTKRAPLFHG